MIDLTVKEELSNGAAYFPSRSIESILFTQRSTVIEAKEIRCKM